MVAQERLDLAETLDELTDAEARTPSLCRGWSVQDVAAHVVMVLQVSTPEFLKVLLRSRGSFDGANNRLTERWSRRGIRELTDALRQEADSTFAPPGAGPDATLADTVIHGMDIREPLGRERQVPPTAALTSLDFLVNLNLPAGQPGPTLIPRKLLDGLHLFADDLDWEHGAGRAVHGSGQHLLLAVTGRLVGARQLTGPGASILLGRLAAVRR